MPLGIYSNNLIHTMQPASIMDSQYSSSSPTLFYTPSEKHQFDFMPTEHFVQSPLSQWNTSTSTDFSVISKSKRPALVPNSSRKRSRDRIDEEDLALGPTETDGMAKMEVIEEPIYGPGMTLLNPSTGTPISAESQSGTWLEERAEEELIAEQKRVEAQRPILRPSKSSRLDLSIVQSESPIASVELPSIDPASAMLGVGWKVMSSTDEDMQKAIRGWAKYIENHYPLNGVQILSKSESKEAFLVQSDEGYWLFKEDLDEGRLVSISWQGCVAGLTSVPTTFEGSSVLTAQRSPSPVRDDPYNVVAAEVTTGMDLD